MTSLNHNNMVQAQLYCSLRRPNRRRTQPAAPTRASHKPDHTGKLSCRLPGPNISRLLCHFLIPNMAGPLCRPPSASIAGHLHRSPIPSIASLLYRLPTPVTGSLLCHLPIAGIANLLNHPLSCIAASLLYHPPSANNAHLLHPRLNPKSQPTKSDPHVGVPALQKADGAAGISIHGSGRAQLHQKPTKM
jgi:hypothetical protein